MKEDMTEKITGAVPTQADILRSIGERLNVDTAASVKKGNIPLDIIIYYMENMANLDNLNSVWNALIEMGVANDVKKWIKIYARVYEYRAAIGCGEEQDTGMFSLVLNQKSFDRRL